LPKSKKNMITISQKSWQSQKSVSLATF